MPFEKRLGIPPKVDHNVKHRAPDTVNHLDLGLRRVLEMHAAQSTSFSRQGVVDLHDLLVMVDLLELSAAEGTCETAALIFKGVRH